MPTFKRDHSDNRKVVCLMCFRKPKNQLRNISDTVKNLIVKHLVSDPKNNLSENYLTWLPSVICIGCCKQLKNFDGDTTKTVKHIDFDNFDPPQSFRSEVVTRSTLESECTCSVCRIAQIDNKGKAYTNYHDRMSEQPGRPSTSAVEVIWPHDIIF